jgi:hypothetical protein
MRGATPFQRDTLVTLGHFLFIPTVFFIGMLSGFAAATHRSGGSPARSVTRAVRPVVLLSALGLFLVTLLATHFAPIPGGVQDLHVSLDHHKIFDQNPSFSLEETYRRVSGFGEAGREAYQRFTYTTDLIFPLALLFFLFVFARFVAERVVVGKAPRIILIAAPFLWFTSDLIENGILYFLLSTYPAQQVVPASMLAYVSVLKFSLLVVSFVLPLAVYAVAARVVVLPKVGTT